MYNACTYTIIAASLTAKAPWVEDLQFQIGVPELRARRGTTSGHSAHDAFMLCLWDRTPPVDVVVSSDS